MASRFWVVGCGGQDCREPPCAAIHGLEGGEEGFAQVPEVGNLGTRVRMELESGA